MQKKILQELKMIDAYKAKKYCKEELSKIENYDKAIADATNTWDLHHRTEIWWNCTAQDLIDNECYYNRKACELIFLTHAEHTRLHNMHMSESRRRKMSDSMKGKNKGRKMMQMPGTNQLKFVKVEEVQQYLDQGYVFSSKEKRKTIANISK